jgi:arylsulfatase A-like enzyme
MMIRWPGHIQAGSVYKKLVSSADLYRTLITAATLEMPEETFDSVDLLPYLTGAKTDAPHDWLCWQNRSWLPKSAGGKVVHKSRIHNSAIRKGKWKLVRLDENLDSKDDPPEWRLYDLVSDIGEQRDVAAKHPEVVRELGQLFNGWRSDMHPSIAAGPSSKPRRPAKK